MSERRPRSLPISLARTLSELEARCREAEETLEAIRSGDVDALVVDGPQGAQVYTLKGAEQPYRVMVERMQEGAATLSRDGVVLYTNDRLALMLQIPIERLTGCVLEAFVDPEERATFRTLIETGDGRLESTFIADDGSVIPVFLAAARLPLDVDGTVCLVVTDLTLRKQSEAMALADRRKGDFIAMLSHELRNPLGPLLHAAHVLQRVTPGEPLVQHAQQVVMRQVTHMAKIVDDLLEVSRINRGQILLRRETVDLAKLVRTTIEDHRAALEAKKLSLEVELPDESVWTSIDPTRMAQVVGNLLHNAGKFTDAGHVLVRLAVEDDGATAVLTVRDSGIGMDHTTLRSLFDSFSQADRSLDRTRGGLGLGLTLVKGLIELHGGQVKAGSEGLGHGSHFECRLPLDGAHAPDRPLASDEATGRPYRVLVIEDHPDAAESLQVLLELSGHTVVIAPTGVAGVEKARTFQPEVVLCDIGLPGEMDGYAVARALRAEPGLSTCRLVALTGYGRQQDRQRARDAGFDLHVVKPVDVSNLERLLRQPRLSADCAPETDVA